MKPNKTLLLLGLAALLLSAVPFPPASALTDPVPEPEPIGNHLLTHVRAEAWFPNPTGVMAVETPAGEVAMYVVAYEDAFYVTDGAEDGEPRPLVILGDLGTTSWTRLDVVLHGDTYTVYGDQAVEVTARTFVHATGGRLAADPGPLGGPYHGDFERARERVDLSGMAFEDTFQASNRKWEAVGNPDSFEFGGGGHLSRGSATIYNTRNPGVAYVRAPTADFDGAYNAEASVTVGNNLNVPIGHVALAGISGPAEAPRVQWAVMIDRPLPLLEDGNMLTVNRWALHFVDADGTRTQVSPSWVTTLWHTVDVRVDESNDFIAVSVDEAEPYTFTTELGTSTYVAAGDVGTVLGRAALHAARYDELAIYEEAAT